LEAVRRNMPLPETSTDVTSPKFGIEFTCKNGMRVKRQFHTPKPIIHWGVQLTAIDV